LKVWLDDLRDPRDDTWTWVTTVDDVIAILETQRVEELSLDNDLGEGVAEGRKVVLWMAEHTVWPTGRVNVHSANPVSVEHMVKLIERYGPDSYRRVLGRPEFRSS
jgi:hypothetical protein